MPTQCAGHERTITSLAFNAESNRLVTGGADRLVKVWDVSSGKELHSFAGHAGSVAAVLFGPDGKQVYSGSTDGTVKIWDLAAGKEAATLAGHAAAVSAISPATAANVTGSNGATP